MPLEAFDAFADSMLRRHPINTRRSYCRHLAEFFDYLFEATARLSTENQDVRFTRRLLQEIVEAYDTYLTIGAASGNRIAALVDSGKPSPRHKPSTSALMHAPVRKFLRLSEDLRLEMKELSEIGLRAATIDPHPLLREITGKRAPVLGQRQQMAATSMISGVISGGPKLLKGAILRTVSPQVDYNEARAFPFDRIASFINALSSYREKSYYAFLAASGARSHEALQLLQEDINASSGLVFLRNPRIRANHPSYLSLTSTERERLAWKGRNTESTLLIEPFASMFFENLACYRREEYIPHGVHSFVFQYTKRDFAGAPYFLSAASTRLESFHRAVSAASIQEQVSGPHSLRHAYGTYLLNYFPRASGDYGLPVAMVQQLMGHANVKSTLQYARYDKDLMELELRHANAMIYDGATPKSILQLKLEALNAQIRKIQKEIPTPD